MNARYLLLSLVVLSLSSGCADRAGLKLMMSGPQAGDAVLPPDAPPTDVNPTDPEQCDQGYSYQGFGGTRLEVGRDEDQVGFDRDRVKPLSALRGEYARVLGFVPPVLETLTNTFGSVPPRWFVEPEATAVSLFSSMRVAFAGCLTVTNTTAFDAVPDAVNARVKCADFAHRYWNRAADKDELDSCVDVVTTKTAEEPDARRKWAYACASVLSSASFLTY